jgi:hypothetical protein
VSGAPTADPHERLISGAGAILCICVAMPILALAGQRFSQNRMTPGMSVVLIPPLLLLLLAGVLLRGLRSQRVPRWLGGGRDTAWLGVLAVLLLGGLKPIANAAERLMVANWNLTASTADLVTTTVLVAGAAAFAMLWRRASRSVPNGPAA